ncbi:hypothetical protein Barb6XT_03151 [Bacteroidales bacterium Barb6XT]|nr:hypothetical protein Barb6XT_03151 [Bacteroidales bacterium Barb6XT]
MINVISMNKIIESDIEALAIERLVQHCQS